MGHRSPALVTPDPTQASFALSALPDSGSGQSILAAACRMFSAEAPGSLSGQLSAPRPIPAQVGP